MEVTRVSANTVRKYQRQNNDPIIGNPHLTSLQRNEELCTFIESMFSQYPTLLLNELRTIIMIIFEIDIPKTSLNRLVHNIDYKNKKINIIARRRKEEHIKTQRNLFSITARCFNSSRFVFIDESHFTDKNVCRTRGWGRTGDDWSVYSHKMEQSSYSLLSALSINGTIYSRIIETSIDGVKGEDFETFLMNLYLRLPEDSILVLDNAKIHKTERVREILRSLNINYMFLPPYSPDMNPIELYFQILKKNVRDFEFYNVPCKVAIESSVRNFNNHLIPSLFNHFERVCKELADQ